MSQHQHKDDAKEKINGIIPWIFWSIEWIERSLASQSHRKKSFRSTCISLKEAQSVQFPSHQPSVEQRDLRTKRKEEEGMKRRMKLGVENKKRRKEGNKLSCFSRSCRSLLSLASRITTERVLPKRTLSDQRILEGVGTIEGIMGRVDPSAAWCYGIY